MVWVGKCGLLNLGSGEVIEQHVLNVGVVRAGGHWLRPQLPRRSNDQHPVTHVLDLKLTFWSQ